jgi:hypothetical protein
MAMSASRLIRARAQCPDAAEIGAKARRQPAGSGRQPRLARITDYERRLAGDRRGSVVRDVRDEKEPAVVCALPGNTTYRCAGILWRFDGSDGTRTRDLRRDRPVMLFRGWPGLAVDLPRGQDFPSAALGDCRAPSGALGTSCGMDAGCTVVLSENRRQARQKHDSKTSSPANPKAHWT